MDKKTDNKFEAVFCIVNAGFSESVMNAARTVGVTGGTIIHAGGTASPNAEKLFGISISPEKEIVMMVVDKKIKDDVLHNLYSAVGLNTAGSGIAFSLPVSDAVGINTLAEIKKQNNQ